MREPLHVVGEAEDRRAALGVVRADALEDARAVVQPVRADVDGRVRPVDQLAVHPDLARLAHRNVSSVVRAKRDNGTPHGAVKLPRDPPISALVSRARSAGASPPCASASRLRSRRARAGGSSGPSGPRDTFGAGNGATRAGLEAGRGDDLLGPRDPRVARPRGGGDLVRVGAPVARDERERRAARRRRRRAT